MLFINKLSLWEPLKCLRERKLLHDKPDPGIYSVVCSITVCSEYSLDIGSRL